MTKKSAIALVKDYQRWRRGEIDTYELFSDSPKSIGEALDIIVEMAESSLKRKKQQKKELKIYNQFKENYFKTKKAIS